MWSYRMNSPFQFIISSDALLGPSGSFPWSVEALLTLEILDFPTVIVVPTRGDVDRVRLSFPWVHIEVSDAPASLPGNLWIDVDPRRLSQYPRGRRVCFTDDDRLEDARQWPGPRLRSWRLLPILFLVFQIRPSRPIVWPDWDTYETSPSSQEVYRLLGR